MAMLKNMAVCEITDIYFYAEKNGIATWNGIQELIYRDPNVHTRHSHFCRDAFVLTENFFKRKYQDDAYGLRWHPTVRKAFKGFLEHHKLTQLVILTTKNCSTSVL